MQSMKVKRSFSFQNKQLLSGTGVGGAGGGGGGVRECLVIMRWLTIYYA